MTTLVKCIEEEIDWLTESGEGIEFMKFADEEGCTVLHDRIQDRYTSSIYRQPCEFVCSLMNKIKNSKDLHRRDAFGRTPWYYLLENILQPKKKFQKRLEFASEDNMVEKDRAVMLVKAMINCAGVESLGKPLDYSGQLPIHVALSFKNATSDDLLLELVQVLLQAYPAAAKARTKVTSGRNRTRVGGELPLHCACRERPAGRHNLELITLIHSAYPEALKQRNTNEETPLNLLCQHPVTNYFINTMNLSKSYMQSSETPAFQRLHDEMISFAMEAYPAALGIPDIHGNLPFHHVTEAVLQNQLYFPIKTVWRQMVRNYPFGLFIRNNRGVCALSRAWRGMEEEHNGIPELMQIAVEELMKAERDNGVPLTLAVSNSLPHVLAYVSSTFETNPIKFKTMLNRHLTFEHLKQDGGCIKQDNDLNSNTVLHVFCLGMKWWNKSCIVHSESSSSEEDEEDEENSEDEMDNLETSDTFDLVYDQPITHKDTVIWSASPQATKSAFGNILRSILDIDPEAVHKHNKQGFIPLHLAFLNRSNGDRAINEQLCLMQTLLSFHPLSTVLPTVKHFENCNATDQQLGGLYPFMLSALPKTKTTDTKSIDVSAMNITFVLFYRFVAVRRLDELM